MPPTEPVAAAWQERGAAAGRHECAGEQERERASKGEGTNNMPPPFFMLACVCVCVFNVINLGDIKARWMGGGGWLLQTR